MKVILDNIRGDKAIWAFLTLLAIGSFFPVYSASANLAYVVGTGTTGGYLVKHFVVLVLGFVIMFTVHKVPYNYFKALSIIMLPVVLFLLAWTLFQGAFVNESNAGRWIRLPFVGLSFQPSGFASVVFFCYTARYLARFRKQREESLPFVFKNSLKYFWVPVLLIVILIFPSNFSTAFILLFVAFILCVMAGYPLKYLLRIGLSGLGFLILFLIIAKTFPDLMPHRVDTWMSRIDNFFDSSDADAYYQVEKAKIAIATGGITGVGAGKSVMKNFLPQSSSDFIYAIIIEEYGLVGGLGLLMIYMLVFIRLIILVNKTRDIYGKLLVAGLTFYIFTQAFINMAVAVELIPVTGQNLPFVSAGGTSIWMTCLSFGIILAVSSNNAKLQTAQSAEAEPSQEIINSLETLDGTV